MSKATSRLEAAMNYNVQKAQNLQIRLEYCQQLKVQRKGICEIRDSLFVEGGTDGNTPSENHLTEAYQSICAAMMQILMEHAQCHGEDDEFLAAIGEALGRVDAIRFYRDYHKCPLLEAKQAIDKILASR